MIFAAHDDDLILGVGGKVLRCRYQGNKVQVCLFSNGETSHQIVLGINENPSPDEVKMMRREEFLKAIEFLGLGPGCTFFFDFPTRQIEGLLEYTKAKVMMALQEYQPDEVYFHFPDAHTDHKGVSQAVLSALQDMPEQQQRPSVFQFFIWTKDLAQGRADVDPNSAPEILENAEMFSLAENELSLKRRALYEMRSQIQIWPYSNWQLQTKPILDKNFIEYFLRGEEIFLPVSLD